MASVLPTDPAERKSIPVMSGVLDYFPAALAEVARVSKAGNDQHNPGQPLHWARGKSTDQADTLVRHLMERGTLDTDGMRHSAKVAWRALALLQTELEEAGLAPLARGARLPEAEASRPTTEEYMRKITSSGSGQSSVRGGIPMQSFNAEQDASLGRLATEGVGMTAPKFEHDAPSILGLVNSGTEFIAGSIVITEADEILLESSGYEYSRSGDVWQLR